MAYTGSVWRCVTVNRNSAPTGINPHWIEIVSGGGGTITGSGTAGAVAVWTDTTALGTSQACLTVDPPAPADGFILYGRQIGGVGPRQLAIRYPTGPVKIISTE